MTLMLVLMASVLDPPSLPPLAAADGDDVPLPSPEIVVVPDAELDPPSLPPPAAAMVTTPLPSPEIVVPDAELDPPSLPPPAVDYYYALLRQRAQLLRQHASVLSPMRR